MKKPHKFIDVHKNKVDEINFEEKNTNFHITREVQFKLFS